jgi:hypothetical protein
MNGRIFLESPVSIKNFAFCNLNCVKVIVRPVKRGEHKVHLYLLQCLSPRRNWDPPTSTTSPARECASHRNQRGDTLACGLGGVGVPIRRLEKRPSTLSTLSRGAKSHDFAYDLDVFRSLYRVLAL